MEIEVEAANLREVEEALESGVHRILLDNMELETIHRAVALINNKAQIEVSGGITLESLDDISKTGVDFVSVGALTHSARASNISMNLY